MSILARLREQFSPDRFVTYVGGELIPNLIVAAATFLAFFILWKVVSRALRVLERTQLDATARSFVQQALKYVVFTVGTISALAQLGIDTSSLLASLGVAGLTIGFAARDTLSNLISGLFIFWDRPFVVGDLIETSGQYGRVDEITMRSTRVVTNDGRMLAIPNSQIVNSTVHSYTNFPNLRLEIDVTVAVDEDFGRIRQLLLAIVEKDERFLEEPAPTVVVTALNDYNVGLQFRAWLRDERSHIAVRFELRERAFETLRRAEVDMPYETLQVLMPSATGAT
ncbi:MAG: mechanosensitive ion channel family protein [Myxococcota bacterium]